VAWGSSFCISYVLADDERLYLAGDRPAPHAHSARSEIISWNVPHHLDMNGGDQSMFDYIIVGAGSAGCVLAHRLSEDPSCKVLLIEAGGDDTLPLSRIPGAYSQLQDTYYDWGYRTAPQRHLHGRRIFQPRGKVLGGSSAINYMVYIRGNRGDYDHWQDLGNDGWSYEDVLPCFVRMECNQRLQDQYHGSTGPITVSDHSERSPLSDTFVEAAQKVGIPLNSDFNGAVQEGCGYYQMTCRDNARCSATCAEEMHAFGRPSTAFQSPS
jgi:choline dehydrogenase